MILAGFAAEPKYKGKLKVVGKGFSDELYGVGIKKGDAAMVEKVNTALKAYIDDGSWKASLDQTVASVRLQDPQAPHPGELIEEEHDRRGSPLERARRSSWRQHEPFASLDPAAVATIAAAARVERFEAGELIVDAFIDPNSEMFVVIEGQVDVWNDRDRLLQVPDERLGPGEVFGFSSMLTERSVGPRVRGDRCGPRWRPSRRPSSRPPSPRPRAPASWPSTCRRPSGGEPSGRRTAWSTT